MSLRPTLPNQQIVLTKRMDTKKTWENNPPSLILEVRPSHCPLEKISNASLPTPSDKYIQYGIVPL